MGKNLSFIYKETEKKQQSQNLNPGSLTSVMVRKVALKPTVMKFYLFKVDLKIIVMGEVIFYQLIISNSRHVFFPTSFILLGLNDGR